MSQPHTPFDALAELQRRCERLERQHRRLKGALLVVLIAGLGFAAAGAMQNKPRVVEAENFVLRDAEGKIRGAWSVGKEGPMLSLANADGLPRVVLSVNKLGTGLTLNDAAGKPRASQVVLPDGAFEFSIAGKNSQPRGLWRVGDEGSRLGIIAADGKRLLWLMADNSMSGLACYDTPERKRVMLAANASGPALGLHDADGKVRQILSVFDDSGPDLRLLDAEGQPIFAQPQ